MSELTDEQLHSLVEWYEPDSSGRAWLDKQVVAALHELRELRAWKAGLEIGKLEFALDQYDKSRNPCDPYNRECAMFDVETEARALVDRAKETP